MSSSPSISPPKLRVLRVITSLDPAFGGPPQGIRNLAPDLEKKGIVQDVAAFDHANQGESVPGIREVFQLGPATTSLNIAPKFEGWLAKNLSNYDAVIVHGIWQYHTWQVRQEIEKRREKGAAPAFYIYPHGMLDPWFQQDPSRRLKAWRNKIYWKFVEKRTINAADAVLFTCEQERVLASTTFPGYAATEKTVGYGVPEPPAATEEMGRAFHAACPELGDRPYLLFISRIDPKKGIDLLIDSYLQHLHEGSDLPALVICGPHETEFARAMRAKVDNFPLSEKLGKPNIFFPGMVQGEAKWGALHGAEAMILPSHQENFGIAVVEALACGKPVLITDKVNIWREIAEAEGGFVETDTLEGTSKLLTTWTNLSAEDRAHHSRQALAVYQSKFGIDQATTTLANYLLQKHASDPK